MKKRDSTIKLIGWGGHDSQDESWWAQGMLEGAGEYLEYVAMHMMSQSAIRQDTVLHGMRYTRNPEQAWDELNELADQVEKKISDYKGLVVSTGSDAGIAVTEGHLSLAPHNECQVLQEWLSAVYHARSMNSYQRHGDRVKIATLCDFAGSRWTVNAIKLRVPQAFGAVSYLLPAGSVMRLFKRHNGTQGIAVKSSPPDLDIAASRTDDRIFLHVANKSYSSRSEVTFRIDGYRVDRGVIHQIAPNDLRTYISHENPDVFAPEQAELPENKKWSFPAGSVSVVELTISLAPETGQA